MGILDILNGQDGGPGGLLAFLQANAGAPQTQPGGLPSDIANYGPMSLAGPQAAPMQMQARAPVAPAPVPSTMPTDISAASRQPAPMSMGGPVAAPAPAAPVDSSPGMGDRLGLAGKGFLGNMASGPIGALIGGIAPLVTGKPTDAGTIAQQQTAKFQNSNAQALLSKGADPAAVNAAIVNAVAGNKEPLNKLFEQHFGPQNIDNLGNGYIRDKNTGKITRAYEPDDKTPNSVLEYKYYVDNLPKGQQPMGYDTWSTAKARAGATSINNNVDMNSGMTYDKQLAEGLGKAHASLANGVEDAQTRARDIAAMQGAVDAIQKNGGTTGGLAPGARLEIQKSINAGAAALGIDKPFSESDLADKEFLTKFNRSMAGAQAKGAVGARVTNFEMSNFLKANPGLDMTLTGNQRLLGIQSQIEERNIAVGNAIRDATAAAISQGRTIDPVTVQGIVTNYDKEHHIKDVVTGQDLTQSYALPEFQNANPTNAAMSGAHSENLKAMEKTIGGTTYIQRDGKWYPK